MIEKVVRKRSWVEGRGSWKIEGEGSTEEEQAEERVGVLSALDDPLHRCATGVVPSDQRRNVLRGRGDVALLDRGRPGFECGKCALREACEGGDLSVGGRGGRVLGRDDGQVDRRVLDAARRRGRTGRSVDDSRVRSRRRRRLRRVFRTERRRVDDDRVVAGRLGQGARGEDVDVHGRVFDASVLSSVLSGRGGDVDEDGVVSQRDFAAGLARGGARVKVDVDRRVVDPSDSACTVRGGVDVDVVVLRSGRRGG